MTSPARPHLLGFWMCVALVVGNSIGSGVFLLPASLAPYGLNSVIAWGFTACGALLLAIVFASLSRAFPAAGGPYAYVNLAFGPLTAFIVAWGYWISIWVGNAAIATGAVSYLTPMLPWIASVPGASAAVTLGFLWLLTLVNWYGIQASGGVQSVTTVLKVMPLLAIALLGLFTVRSGNIAAAHIVPLSLSGTTAAATLTLWALLGLESATIPADKVRDPSRTIPAATLLGTVLTAVICILACTTVLLLVLAANAGAVECALRRPGNPVLGKFRRQTAGDIRRDQRIRSAQRLDSPAGRIAQCHGQERRLPQNFRSRVAAANTHVRTAFQQRLGDAIDSRELPEIHGQHIHVHDFAVDHGLPRAICPVFAGAAALAVDRTAAGWPARRAAPWNGAAGDGRRDCRSLFVVGHRRRRRRSGVMGRRVIAARCAVVFFGSQSTLG